MAFPFSINVKEIEGAWAKCSDATVFSYVALRFRLYKVEFSSVQFSPRTRVNSLILPYSERIVARLSPDRRLSLASTTEFESAKKGVPG